MQSTKLVIEIEAKNKYSDQELENLSEQICNFLAGPDGDGLIIGKKYDQDDKKFEITRARIKIPEENIWVFNVRLP